MNLSWVPRSCFTECETQSAAGRKGNFRLQRQEHLSVFQCHSCLGWMEKSDTACVFVCTCARVCVCPCTRSRVCGCMSARVSFLLTNTISHLLPSSIGSTYFQCCLYVNTLSNYVTGGISAAHINTDGEQRERARLTVREFPLLPLFCTEAQVFLNISTN